MLTNILNNLSMCFSRDVCMRSFDTRFRMQLQCMKRIHQCSAVDIGMEVRCGISIPLKRKCRQFDEILITGCTGSCHFDNFQCSQWWKFHQNEDISVSVSLAPIETVSPGGTFCDTVQVPSDAGDLQVIEIEIRYGNLSRHPVSFWPSRKGYNHVLHDVHWCIFSPITAVKPQWKV